MHYRKEASCHLEMSDIEFQGLYIQRDDNENVQFEKHTVGQRPREEDSPWVCSPGDRMDRSQVRGQLKVTTQYDLVLLRNLLSREPKTE